jgi:hypothetical protein
VKEYREIHLVRQEKKTTTFVASGWIMETLTMMSRYDPEPLKDIAVYLFGIQEELAWCDRPTVTPKMMLERFRRT